MLFQAFQTVVFVMQQKVTNTEESLPRLLPNAGVAEQDKIPVPSEVWSVHIPVVLEKTLESPLGSEGIKPVNPKGSQP